VCGVDWLAGLHPYRMFHVCVTCLVVGVSRACVALIGWQDCILGSGACATVCTLMFRLHDRTLVMEV
jgi:hypothetical protein